MASQAQPQLLYTVPGVRAFHIQDGQEQSLSPSGPQELQMLMIAHNSSHEQPSTSLLQATTENDYSLHLTLPPELELPMPATTQVFHQQPDSYLIPRLDLSPDGGVFTRIQLGRPGQGCSQEDIDTFETILAQCTAFLERAPAPRIDEPLPAYEAGIVGKGQTSLDSKHGQIVLIDEDNGSVVGELAETAHIYEDSSIQHGHKNPVEITISADGQRVDIKTAEEDYLDMANHPAYKNSKIVGNAAAASRLIVTSSAYIGSMLTSSADNFVAKSKPATTAVEFKPATHERVRKINALTQGAVGLSGKTLGKVGEVAQNAGAMLTRRDKKAKSGQPAPDYKPGFLNKSMIAFSTIADGVAHSGKSLLTQSSSAASQVVSHKYGAEAGSITSQLAGGVKNVGLVYIDATGVSRKAVIKAVAKGMVVGKVRGGGQVVVGGGDGGELPVGAQGQSGPPSGTATAASDSLTGWSVPQEKTA